MSRQISIIIEGTPYSKQSVRSYIIRYRTGENKGDVITFTDKKGKKNVFMQHYTANDKAKQSKKLIEIIKAELPKDWKPFENYVHVKKCNFIYAPLKSFNKKQMKIIEDYENGISDEILYKNTKPDLVDNLKKMLWDSLVKANVLIDDSKVVSEENTKKFFGLEARTELLLEGD